MKNYRRNRKRTKKKDHKNNKYEPISQWDKPTWVKDNNVIDYLSEDDDVIQNGKQKYVCISCCALREKQLEEELLVFCEKHDLAPHSTSDIISKWNEFAGPKQSMKIRGCYGDWDDANKRVAYLRRVHGGNHFIFIGEVGKWLPFDPDPDKIKNQNFYEEELNDMHEKYEMNRSKTKEHYETRKQELMRKARLEGSKWGQANYMKEKESFEAVEYKVKTADQQIAEFEEKIAQAKSSKKLALQKLEYMKEHPEVVEQKKEDIEDIIPEDIKEKILSNEIGDKTKEALKIHREIDQNRKPFVIQNPKDYKNETIKEENVINKTFTDNILPHEMRKDIKKI